MSAAGFDLQVAVGRRAHPVTGKHVVREAESDRAGRVEAGQLGGREVDLQGAQIVLQLRESADADERCHHIRVYEAGVLLGAAFLWRRNIWSVAALHFTWNTAEQLLGIPVSGHVPDGLFTVDTHGSAILVGGSFGLEASVVPVLIAVTLAVPMLVLSHRNSGIKPRRRAGH